MQLVGLTIKERSSGLVFLSLGSHGHGFCMWQLHLVSHPPLREQFFSLVGAEENPHFAHESSVVDGKSRFVGTPLSVVVLGVVPKALWHHGILLKCTGPDEELVAHSLRAHTQYLVEDLKKICRARGVPLAGSRSRRKKSEWLSALICSIFPEGAELDDMIKNYAKKFDEAHIAKDEILKQVLEMLGPSGTAEISDTLKHAVKMHKLNRQVQEMAAKNAKREKKESKNKK